MKLRTNAIWVVCNLIGCSSATDLLNVILKYRETVGEVDIIHPLCYNLLKIEKSELKLLIEMIKAISILLRLDSEFPVLLEDSHSVKSMVLRLQGFDAIDKLQHHPDAEIYSRCTELVNNYIGKVDEKEDVLEIVGGDSDRDILSIVIESAASFKRARSARDHESCDTNMNSTQSFIQN